MISKGQFLELKHLKSLGVPTTTVGKKLGISVPSVNKWVRIDEDAFENYLRNNTPYLEQYRAFILSILKICPQTQATNIMYRIKDQFPDFNCKKTTFFRYVKDLRLHPVAEYLKRGVTVSLCSDDPVCQEHETLTDDFFAGTVCWDLDLSDIKQLCLNSILYSGLDKQQKSQLSASWKKAWDEFLDRFTEGC